MKLKANQMLALQVSERTMSVLSILGSSFILCTFLRWHYFRKPINRLVFYASFGNILTNVATLIATSALPAPDHWSSFCEFQGILIQWFMMADSLWVFCMALNVMLVFFWSYTSLQLRGLEKWYILCSYGLPAIPAFTYIFIDHFGKRKIIGNATIWCWVSADAEWMRIAFFYGPVWIIIVCTLTIYVVTGHKIFKKRAALRSFSRNTVAESLPVVSNPFTAAHLNNIEKTTDIRVVTETIDSDLADVSPVCGNESRSSFSSTRKLSPPVQTVPPLNPTNGFSRITWPTITRESAVLPNRQEEVPTRGYQVTVSAHPKNGDLESGAARSTSVSRGPITRRRTATMEGNRAAWGYFKVAFLMFAALFIVWVPSTVNRMQQFADRNHPIFALNLASALVLPLQGFWNAMVYISTTWPECKRAWSEILKGCSSDRRTKDLVHRPRKASEDTLTNSEDYEFEADTEIPLHDMLTQAAPVHGHIHAQLSSSETTKPLPPAPGHSKP